MPAPSSTPLQYSCLENPVDRGAWWAAVHRVAQSRTLLKQLSMHVCIGKGNGTPLQYSCLENPRDRGTWWAAICGVTQSRTQLKRISSSSRRGTHGFWGRCTSVANSEQIFTTFQPQPRFYAGRFINIFKKKKWVREFRNSDIVATRLTNTPHCYLLFLILKKYRLLIFIAHIQEQKKWLKCLLPPIIWDYIKEVLVNLASFVL